MSIFLKPVQRANPSDPDAPKKWYPVQYTTKMVYADSRRDDPQPDGGSDGDTPAAQGGATPAAGRQEREVRRLGHVQRHPQHRGRRAQGRPHRPADEMKAAMQKADFVWLDKIMESGTASGSDDNGGSEDNEDTTENPLG